MHSQEIAIELPSQGARRATGEGSNHGWQKPGRFSARQQTEVVLRLLRGEPLDLVSRELEIPAARLTTWRETFCIHGRFDILVETNCSPVSSTACWLGDCT